MRLFGNHKTAGLTWCLSLGFSLLSHAVEVKALESFPSVDRLWMGLEEGSIRPAAYEQIRASSEGFLALNAKDGQILKKDEQWAVMDPEQLDIERKTLAVEETKLERQLKKTREDARDAQLRASLELHETEREREVLVDASQEPGIPVALRNRAAEAVEKIDEQIALLREKADPATMEKEVQVELDEGQLQIARKRKQFLTLEKRSLLVAGFDGELRLSDPLKKLVAAAAEPDALLWVNANEHLATLVDDDRYEISVMATSPVLAQIPREDLLVFLQEGQTGRLIAGEYARTDEIDSGAEIVRHFIFNIRETALDEARHSMGQLNLVHVYRKFSEPFRLVHKKDIAFLAPEVLATSGWDGLVRHLWPGSVVIQVGPQAIAVKAKNEN